MFRPLAPPAFGGPPAAAKPGEPPPGTRPHRTRGLKRRHLLAQDAAEIDGALPGPGESTHLLMSGRYDLMQVVERVILRTGRVEHLRLATLSLNRRTVADLLRLADAGRLARVSLVASHYFRTADKGVWREASDRFAERGWPLAAPRCHAKVVAIAFADGQRLAMEGSANLRSNKNFEQLAVVSDPGLHDWHSRWIDLVCARHAQPAASE